MDELSSDGRTTTGRVPTTSWRGWFLPVVTLYTLGLVFWLILGLLPTLADAFAPFHHWVETIATSSSSLAGPAARILDANQSMPGMALEASNHASVAWAYCFSMLNLVLGLVLIICRSTALVPRLLAFALLGTAATFNKPSHAVFHIIGEPWPVKTVHFTFHIVSGVTYLWAVLLFPDGRLPRQIPLRGKPLAAVAVVVTVVIAVVSWQSSFINHPQFFVVFFGVVVSLAGITAQALRVTDPLTTPAEHRSARLLGAALLPAFITGVMWLGARAGAALGVESAHQLELSLQGVFPAVFAIVPVVLFAGILRYRLWNIDWLLSRGLLYGSLAAIVAGAYVVAVSLVGLVAGSSPWTVVVVLSVVAVAIEPLRRALRNWCNRIVYGQVLSPTDAVRTMLSSLEHLAPGADLAQLTETVTHATRAVRCEVWLTAEDHLLRVAAYPDPVDPDSSDPDLAYPYPADRPSRRPLSDGDEPEADQVGIPITYRSRPLGLLTVELPAGTTLGSVETQLIEDLAGHAGVVVHNAALNGELARHVALLADQLEELRASRRRVVEAQDAERRRLERDLHDGAQQSLVAVIIGLRTASALRASPLEQRAEIRQAVELLGETSATLSELVSAGAPRVLADQGLVPALAAAAEVAKRSGQHVDVHGAVGPGLPPDFATAVYFCCLEAIQNATKHARATRIGINITEADGLLAFEVADDGVGFDPSSHAAGSGLRNLSSRMSVIGGDVNIESAPGSGTVVRGWLPLMAAAVPA
jgi:signal transduction histidine kinase